MSRPVILHGGMDHDPAKENWEKRTTNRYCPCPPWRYHPAHPAPTNPDCPQHGTQETPQ